MTAASLARQVALSLIALSVLVGCGRRGEPSPPGPPAAVTFPKTFPPPTGP